MATYTELGSSGAVAGGLSNVFCIHRTTQSGGAVCGGSAKVYLKTTKTTSGGMVASGTMIYAEYMYGSGGVVSDGVSSNNAIHRPDHSGGAVCGGSSKVSIITSKTSSGGVVCQGTGLDSQIIFGHGGTVCGGFANLHPTGVVVKGTATVRLNNKIYIRDLIVGDQVFYLQKTRLSAAVVQTVIYDSEDKFYVIQKARMPGWLLGQSASFTIHESHVLPADNSESYDLLQQLFN